MEKETPEQVLTEMIRELPMLLDVARDPAASTAQMRKSLDGLLYRAKQALGITTPADRLKHMVGQLPANISIMEIKGAGDTVYALAAPIGTREHRLTWDQLVLIRDMHNEVIPALVDRLYQNTVADV